MCGTAEFVFAQWFLFPEEQFPHLCKEKISMPERAKCLLPLSFNLSILSQLSKRTQNNRVLAAAAHSPFQRWNSVQGGFFSLLFFIHVLSPVNLFSSPVSFVSCIPGRKTTEAATSCEGSPKHTGAASLKKRRLSEESSTRSYWQRRLLPWPFPSFLCVWPTLRSFVRMAEQNVPRKTHVCPW